MSAILELLGYIIAFIYSIPVLFSVIFSFIKSPFEVFRIKERKTPPACLTDPAWTHARQPLEKLTLHYVSTGEKGKPLMLLVHGFPEFWFSWRHQLKEFCKDYWVVAVDMRGYSDSDKPHGVANYHVSEMVSDIKQLIEAFGYKDCVLVGHDWGGVLVWHFTSKYPEMVSSLIVMNAPHFASFLPYLTSHLKQFLKSWYIFLFQIPYLPELLLWMNDIGSMKMFQDKKQSGLKLSEFTDEEVEAYKYCFRDGNFTPPLNYYRAMFRNTAKSLKMSRDPSKTVAKLEMPVMVLWGDQDMALEAELATLSGKYCNDFTLHFIEGASHFVQMDAPDKVNRHMWDFLKSKADN